MNENIKKLYAKAEQHRKNMEFAEAIALYHQITNQVPEDVNYWYLLGCSYFEARNDREAIKYFTKATELKPNFKEAWFMLGEVWSYFFSASKDNVKAAEYYEKAVKIDSHYRKAVHKLIGCLILTQQYEKSLYYCEQELIDFKPNFSLPQRQYLKSIDDYTPILDARFNSLIGLKRFPEAIERIKEYIDIQGYFSKDKYGTCAEKIELLSILYLFIGDKNNFERYLEMFKDYASCSNLAMKETYDYARMGNIQGIVQIPNFHFEFPDFYKL
jgi:tetratricopeptide (TPR) repeat protein